MICRHVASMAMKRAIEHDTCCLVVKKAEPAVLSKRILLNSEKMTPTYRLSRQKAQMTTKAA